MSNALKRAIEDKKKTKRPSMEKILTIRMPTEMYVKGSSILKPRGLSWAAFFRTMAKDMIRASR